MLLSMTGYGEGKACTDFGEIRLEVKSVNHRFLDCKINLPKELSFLEPGFREEIKKKVKRGMIFLNLYWEKSPSSFGQPRLNMDLVRSLDKSLRKLKKELKNSAPIPLDLIASFPGVLYSEEVQVRGKKSTRYRSERKEQMIAHPIPTSNLLSLDLPQHNNIGMVIDHGYQGHNGKGKSFLQTLTPESRIYLIARLQEFLINKAHI